MTFVASEVLTALDGLRASTDLVDPCVDVEGGTAAGVQAFLGWLASRVHPGDAYVEVGSWLGKSIIPAALRARSGVEVVACDNFTSPGGGLELIPSQRVGFYANLRRHGVLWRTRVLEGDFRETLGSPGGPRRVAAYFYDADHREEATYDGLRLVVPHLLPGAVVVVDDWSAAGVPGGGMAGGVFMHAVHVARESGRPVGDVLDEWYPKDTARGLRMADVLRAVRDEGKTVENIVEEWRKAGYQEGSAAMCVQRGAWRAALGFGFTLLAEVPPGGAWWQGLGVFQYDGPQPTLDTNR